MHRNPFHGIGRTPWRFSEFIRTPWIAAARDELGERLLDNPLQLLRRKVDSYLWLSQQWNKAHLVRYEDLVLDVEAALLPTGLLAHKSVERIELPSASARAFGKGNRGLPEYRDHAREVSFDRLGHEDCKWALGELQGSALLELYPA